MDSAWTMAGTLGDPSARSDPDDPDDLSANQETKAHGAVHLSLSTAI